MSHVINVAVDRGGVIHKGTYLSKQKEKKMEIIKKCTRKHLLSPYAFYTVCLIKQLKTFLTYAFLVFFSFRAECSDDPSEELPPVVNLVRFVDDTLQNHMQDNLIGGMCVPSPDPYTIRDPELRNYRLVVSKPLCMKRIANLQGQTAWTWTTTEEYQVRISPTEQWENDEVITHQSFHLCHLHLRLAEQYRVTSHAPIRILSVREMVETHRLITENTIFASNETIFEIFTRQSGATIHILGQKRDFYRYTDRNTNPVTTKEYDFRKDEEVPIGVNVSYVGCTPITPAPTNRDRAETTYYTNPIVDLSYERQRGSPRDYLRNNLIVTNHDIGVRHRDFEFHDEGIYSTIKRRNFFVNIRGRFGCSREECDAGTIDLEIIPWPVQTLSLDEKSGNQDFNGYVFPGNRGLKGYKIINKKEGFFSWFSGNDRIPKTGFRTWESQQLMWNDKSQNARSGDSPGLRS